MKRLPFKIIRRQVIVGGVQMIFGHDGCDRETELTVMDSDDLKEHRQVKCSCGFERILHFGDPTLGRQLLELLKKPEPGGESDTGLKLNR